MQWYKPGVVTSQCHKIPLVTGREILVCISGTGIMGSSHTELYVEDLLRPAATLMSEDEVPFFVAPDNIHTCGYDPEHETKPFAITYSFIEKVDFSSATPPTVSVTASYGRYSPAPEEAKTCASNADGWVKPIPTKWYRLEFTFDGRSYRPTDESAEAAKIFDSNCSRRPTPFSRSPARRARDSR